MSKTKIKTLGLILILLFIGFQITSNLFFYTSEVKAEELVINTKLIERREQIAQRQSFQRNAAQEEPAESSPTATILPITGPIQTPFVLVISIIFGATLLVTWDHVRERIRNKKV